MRPPQLTYPKSYIQNILFYFRWGDNWELLSLLHSHAETRTNSVAVRPLPIPLRMRRLPKRFSDSQRIERRQALLPMPKMPKSDTEIDPKFGDSLRKMQSRWGGLGTDFRTSPRPEQRDRDFTATLLQRSHRWKHSGTKFSYRKTMRGTWQLPVHPDEAVSRCPRVELGDRSEDSMQQKACKAGLVINWHFKHRSIIF